MTLPPNLLRALTHQTRNTTTDSYGQTVTSTWSDVAITGRLDQLIRTETHAGGRETEISEWALLTDTVLTAEERVKDGSTIYEIVGTPWPVYDDTGVHHYQATIRLVEG